MRAAAGTRWMGVLLLVTLLLGGVVVAAASVAAPILAALVGGGLGLVGAVVIVRQVRTATRALSREGFAHAARLNGLPTTGLMVRRVLRGALPVILLVLAAELIGGYGGVLVLPPDSPSWLPGVPVAVTVGALVLSVAVRMARRGAAGSPRRVSAAPPPPGALLPSDHFRATDLLDIRDLQLGPVPADPREPGPGINLTLPRGQALALVGDRASGATELCQAILGAFPHNNPVTSGSILFDGRELVALPEREFRRLRRNQIRFLDSSPRRFDPRVRIGKALTERLAGGPRAARVNPRRALDLLESVGVDAPDTVLERYPHQVSAPTLRRVLLARALAVDPQLVITIDPTRGLGPDASADFLALLHALQRERGFTLLVVSAQLDVVQRCDRVAIMRAGTIVEHASVQDLLTEPSHLPSRRLLTGATPGLPSADS